MLLDFLFFLNFISQEFNKGFVSFSVQSTTVTCTGVRAAGGQSATPNPPYAEQLKGPTTQPGHWLLLLCPEWHSWGSGSEVP